MKKCNLCNTNLSQQTNKHCFKEDLIFSFLANLILLSVFMTPLIYVLEDSFHFYQTLCFICFGTIVLTIVFMLSNLFPNKYKK